MDKLSIKDLDVKGKRVFVRVDFNVPMDDNGNITDDTRIKAALPTIQYLVAQGAKVILASHLGRPKGQFNQKYSLAPVAKRLTQLLGQNVVMAGDCIGDVVKQKVADMATGDVLLLENVRFYAEEEKNDENFARQLAQLADIYVNDAFGTAHRAHATTAGMAKFMPAVAGLLMEKEISNMGRAVQNPEHPFVAIIGGAKVSDKIGVIENLLTKVDYLLIGGGMANTFLKSKTFNLGASKVEEDKLDLATNLLTMADAKGVKLLLPEDVMIADAFDANANKKVVAVQAIPDGWMALDIGPKTIETFSQVVKEAKTVIWNGPMGVFEMAPFATGTESIAKALAASGALSIVGGGDSVAAVEKMGVADKMTHISTGGGASLEFLEGKTLPGVVALKDKTPAGVCK